MLLSASRLLAEAFLLLLAVLSLLVSGIKCMTLLQQFCFSDRKVGIGFPTFRAA